MVTVFDIALASRLKEKDGGHTEEEWQKTRLPSYAGCQKCGATLGPYNSYPSKTGYIQCKECIEETKMFFSSVEEFYQSEVRYLR